MNPRAEQGVARAAFELALRRNRKVTAVHKANVLKLSDGLFLGARFSWLEVALGSFALTVPVFAACIPLARSFPPLATQSGI